MMVFAVRGVRYVRLGNLTCIYDRLPASQNHFKQIYMSAVVWNIPTYILAIVSFTAGFSRLTHGAYTPALHKWQEYHLHDDGTLKATIVPIFDIIIGVLVLYPKTRFWASALAGAFFLIGLQIQINAGKDFRGDAVLVAIGNVAVLAANQQRRAERLLREAEAKKAARVEEKPVIKEKGRVKGKRRT